MKWMMNMKIFSNFVRVIKSAKEINIDLKALEYTMKAYICPEV